jgi:uncharacterized protein YkwD
MIGRNLTPVISLLLLSLLAACGGDGNSGSTNASVGSTNAATATPAAASGGITAVGTPGTNAPQATGNTATDGYNWINYRRQMVGLSTFSRNSVVDTAAQGHSNYQRLNNTITHEQTAGKPGFTGVSLGNRLSAAGYNSALSAYGEVISSTSDPSGFNAAEDLITAIYHRFVIFDPVFSQAGAGSATVAGGATYFTVDFVATSLTGLGRGRIVSYPVAGQQRVPLNFFSDNEVPDPVPARNEVGYPISVHADIASRLSVKTFTVQPRGGNALQVRTLSHDVDAETPTSAAAIIPLNTLSSGTTYDVQFSGTVDGVTVDRSWSFTTQ